MELIALTRDRQRWAQTWQRWLTYSGTTCWISFVSNKNQWIPWLLEGMNTTMAIRLRLGVTQSFSSVFRNLAKIIWNLTSYSEFTPNRLTILSSATWFILYGRIQACAAIYTNYLCLISPTHNLRVDVSPQDLVKQRYLHLILNMLTLLPSNV